MAKSYFSKECNDIKTVKAFWESNPLFQGETEIKIGTREYFIEQIMKRAPYYKLLHKVKPGITSWGQVKYGYAENVDQMIERLKYDMLYIENMSLVMDLKILIYTVLIVVQGRGK